MRPHGHPHTVKVVDHRTVLNSADHNIYDRDRRRPVVGHMDQAEENAVDQRRRKILPSVGPEDPVINESAAHDLLSSGLDEHCHKQKHECPNAESVKIQMNVAVHDRKQDQDPVHSEPDQKADHKFRNPVSAQSCSVCLKERPVLLEQSIDEEHDPHSEECQIDERRVPDIGRKACGSSDDPQDHIHQNLADAEQYISQDACPRR